MDSIEALANAYVQHEVLGYVAKCPGACDTFKGIIHWWLHEQRRSIGRETVREALDQLVARGSLEEHRLPGGGLLYCSPAHVPPSQQQE